MKPNSSASAFFLLLSILIQLAASLSITNLECQSIIENWLWDVQPTLNKTDATLSLSWKELDLGLSNSSCQYDIMFLELWRSDRSTRRMEWTKEMATLYGGCDSMSNFVLHDKEDRKMEEPAKPDMAVFSHVLEKEYLFRLCPCGNKPSRKDSRRRCNCEYKESRNFCSDIIKLPASGSDDDKVSDLCLSPVRDDNQSVHKIQPPVVECNSAQLSGILLTCTPAQKYDKLLVELHPVDGEVSYCNLDDHDSTLAIKDIVDLKRVNKTHGKFVFDTDGLEIGQAYCIRMQVENQPYCTTSIDTFGGNRQPPICSTVLRRPLKTTDQCQSAAPNVSKALPNWVIALLVTVFVGLLLCFCIFFFKNRNRYKKKFGEKFRSATSVHEKETTQLKDLGQVLLLSFVESEEFADLNLEFKRFISSCGANVVDFSMDNEDLLSRQESWTDEIIQNPNTRIIVVDSPLASEAVLLPDQADQVIIEEEEGQNRPLLEPLDPLRRSCIRLVHAQYRGNGKKLCVVSVRGCQSNNNVIKDLLPSTPWVLPDNLDDVRDWVCQRYRGASEERELQEQRFRDVVNTFVANNVTNQV